MHPITKGSLSKNDLSMLIDKDDPVIVEIGANEGSHSQWFIDAFAKSQVYCFEPDPRAIAKFKQRIGSSQRVFLYESAVSNIDGEVIFHQSGGNKDNASQNIRPEGWDLSGSIKKPKEHLDVYPWCTFDKTITVCSTTLNSWYAYIGGHIDLIWMDTQGAELDIFAGASEVLKNTTYIYTEYSNRELYEGQPRLIDILNYLPEWEVITRYPGDVLLRNTAYCA